MTQTLNKSKAPPNSNTDEQPSSPGTAQGGAEPCSEQERKEVRTSLDEASPPPCFSEPRLASRGKLRYLCLGDRKVCLSETQKERDSSLLQAASHSGRIKAKETTTHGVWF